MMNSKIIANSSIIREIKETELTELLEIYQSLHPTEDSNETDDIRKSFKIVLEDKNLVILVAEYNNKIVASCYLNIIPNLTRGGRPYALIENVVTREGYRRRGFQKRLLKYAFEIAWEKNCYKIMLLTSRQDAGIIEFYEKCDFKKGEKIAFSVYHSSFQR